MLKQPNFFQSQPFTLPKGAPAKFYLSTTFSLSFVISSVVPTRLSTFYADLATKIGNRNLKFGWFMCCLWTQTLLLKSPISPMYCSLQPEQVMQYITLFEVQLIVTFVLNFVFDGLKVMLLVSSVLACTTPCFIAFCDLAWWWSSFIWIKSCFGRYFL